MKPESPPYDRDAELDAQREHDEETARIMPELMAQDAELKKPRATIREAVKAGRITGLFCAHHDKHSMAGSNLTEEYLAKHDQLCTLRVDASPENCNCCGNAAESLYLSLANALMCRQCMKDTTASLAPI